MPDHGPGQTYFVPFPGYYQGSCQCGETFNRAAKADALEARDAHIRQAAQ